MINTVINNYFIKEEKFASYLREANKFYVFLFEDFFNGKFTYQLLKKGDKRDKIVFLENTYDVFASDIEETINEFAEDFGSYPNLDNCYPNDFTFFTRKCRKLYFVYCCFYSNLDCEIH